MNDVFTSKWFISVIAVWITVLVLDELAFLWWRKVNPGSLWGGLLVRHPNIQDSNVPTDSYPNGYRPAGGQ